MISNLRVLSEELLVQTLSYLIIENTRFNKKVSLEEMKKLTKKTDSFEEDRSLT